MPTYGYLCEQCGREFEVWQRMSDEPRASCPECGGDGRRLFFPAGIVFKGTGFYKTDSRRSGGGDGRPAPAAKKAPAKPEAAGATSGESTGAASAAGGSD